MEKCADCTYFLPHKRDGFNCGFLIKRVDKNNKPCCHFHSLNKDRLPAVVSN
jgi:hypothetical protein